MRKIKIALVVIALAVSSFSVYYAHAQENATENDGKVAQAVADIEAIMPCPAPVCNMVCTNTPFCDRLAKELNLTEEQQVKLREILAANRSGNRLAMRGNRMGMRNGVPNPNCPLAKRQAINVSGFRKGFGPGNGACAMGMQGNRPGCVVACPNGMPDRGRGVRCGMGRGNGKGMGRGMGRPADCPLNNGEAVRGNRLGKNRNAGICPNGNATQPIVINIYNDGGKAPQRVEVLPPSNK